MDAICTKLTGEDGAITPWFMFIISLIYCIGANGEFDEGEFSYLLTVLGSDRATDDTVGIAVANRGALDAAIEYASETPIGEFLAEASERLNEDQKLCILVNMADCALSDGDAQSEEQELIVTFQKAFGITDDALRAMIQTLLVKNDHGVFHIAQ